MAQQDLGTSPLAVYTDMDDTDVSAGVRLLETAGFRVRNLGTRDPDRIAEGAAGASALLVGYAEVGAELMDRLPELRIIALMSMGFNNVDLAAASSRGIWVTNLPAVATEEVASHTLALLLSLTRQLPAYAAQAQAEPERWNDRVSPVAPRLSESTLGIVGLGRIGQRVAEMAGPLFGEVVGYDPMLPDTLDVRAELARLGVKRTTLAEVRARATVLTLHVPLTPETHELVDHEFLAAMPAGSYLINVSRGGLISGTALRQAIERGHVAGAALDVLDEEPPGPGHPLLGHPRILITPHVAYLSAFTEAEYVRIQAQNAISALRTGTPDTPVNEPVSGEPSWEARP